MPNRPALRPLHRLALAATVLLAGCGGVPGNISLGCFCITLTPVISLEASATTVAPGAPVTIGVVPSYFSSSCTATISDGNTVLGSATVYPGTGLLTTTFSTAGTHTLSATCGGYTANTVTLTVAAQTVAPIAGGGASTLYPSFSLTNSISAFAATAQGSATATSTLTLPSPLFPFAVATDSTGQLYVGAYTVGPASEVLIYAAGATGSATPVRTVVVPASLGYILGMCVDNTGQLYIAGTGNGSSSGTTWQVDVYAANATGSATPVRMLSGTLPSYTGAVPGLIPLGTDAAGNLYIGGLSSGTVSSNEIAVYAPSATTPTRTITSPSGTSASFSGLAVDPAGDVYTSESATSIVEFGAGASGAATPIRTISGASTQLASSGSVTALALDGVGNLYVAGRNAATSAVLTFGPTAQGNTAPASYLTSSGFSGNVQLAVH